MKILFVGGEADGTYRDVDLDENGVPFEYWKVPIRLTRFELKATVYRLKEFRKSKSLSHWEYHAL